eukprot:760891-Hanusia_phi.AAC.2
MMWLGVSEAGSRGSLMVTGRVGLGHRRKRGKKKTCAHPPTHGTRQTGGGRGRVEPQFQDPTVCNARPKK